MTRHATVNVGRGRPTAQRRVFALILALLGRGGIVGWQEIGESDGPVDEPGRLRQVFQRAVWRTAAMFTHTPITWNQLVWSCLDVYAVKVMKGIHGVSPARYVVVARLQHRFTRRKLTRINTHTVAGVFNGTVDREEQRRREGWEKHWDRLCEIAKTEAGPDVDVVLSLDANRQKPPLAIEELHPDAVLAARSFTDHLIAVPAAGHRVEVDRVKHTPIGIDFHRGLSARIRFPKEETR